MINLSATFRRLTPPLPLRSTSVGEADHELHLFTFARTWTHLFPAVYIYRAGVTCVRCPALASNWATVCLNTRLGAKGNTDVSGLTCRCKNLFGPQNRRLGWYIHVNTHIINLRAVQQRRGCARMLAAKTLFSWSWLGGDLKSKKSRGCPTQKQVNQVPLFFFRFVKTPAVSAHWLNECLRHISTTF